MKGIETMKKIFMLLSMLVFMTFACNLSMTISPSTNTSVPQSTFTALPAMETATPILSSSTSNPSTDIHASTAIIQPSPIGSMAVTFERLTLVISSSVASGANGKEFPRFDAEDAPYWQKTPGHLQVMLGDYYVLQGKFHQPQIYVYPAQDYAELVPGAFESLRRVNNIAFSPGERISADQLPTVPFFNAAQVFASNITIISFQNGSGVRFITQYAQSAAPINNHELFYNFQGVTRDGMYYIIAIFPITVPVLAETGDTGAAIPSGGIAYPDINDPRTDPSDYYASITDLLNATSDEAFTPSINQLDLLIQSIQVAP
jgi:hypothetical protein